MDIRQLRHCIAASLKHISGESAPHQQPAALSRARLGGVGTTLPGACAPPSPALFPPPPRPPLLAQQLAILSAAKLQRTAPTAAAPACPAGTGTPPISASGLMLSPPLCQSECGPWVGAAAHPAIAPSPGFTLLSPTKLQWTAPTAAAPACPAGKDTPPISASGLMLTPPFCQSAPWGGAAAHPDSALPPGLTPAYPPGSSSTRQQGAWFASPACPPGTASAGQQGALFASLAAAEAATTAVRTDLYRTGLYRTPSPQQPAVQDGIFASPHSVDVAVPPLCLSPLRPGKLLPLLAPPGGEARATSASETVGGFSFDQPCLDQHQQGGTRGDQLQQRHGSRERRVGCDEGSTRSPPPLCVLQPESGHKPKKMRVGEVESCGGMACVQYELEMERACISWLQARQQADGASLPLSPCAAYEQQMEESPLGLQQQQQGDGASALPLCTDERGMTELPGQQPGHWQQGDGASVPPLCTDEREMTDLPGQQQRQQQILSERQQRQWRQPQQQFFPEQLHQLQGHGSGQQQLLGAGGGGAVLRPWVSPAYPGVDLFSLLASQSGGEPASSGGQQRGKAAGEEEQVDAAGGKLQRVGPGGRSGASSAADAGYSVEDLTEVQM